jgi:DME family drug/metabolite transporter
MIGELAALGAAVSWAVAALFYGQALSKAKPISANIIRLTLTSAVLLAFLVFTGKLSILTDLPMTTVVLAGSSGIIGLGLGDTVYMASLKMVGIARSVPITCTYPLFNLLLAAVLLNESITWSVGVGAVVIVFGIWLLSRQQDGMANVSKETLYKGLALALATAILWAISIGMMGLAAKGASNLDYALAINVTRVSTIGLCFLGSAPLIDRGSGFLKQKKRTVVSLIAGGIVALGLGWFFFAYSLTQTLESRAVPISAATPLFSTFEGVVLLHEKINTKNALGSAMIVAGISAIFLL